VITADTDPSTSARAEMDGVAGLTELMVGENKRLMEDFMHTLEHIVRLYTQDCTSIRGDDVALQRHLAAGPG